MEKDDLDCFIFSYSGKNCSASTADEFDDDLTDIYADLDKDPPSVKQGSPNIQSKDSLDLYEELVAEEGNAKELSHVELQNHFDLCQKELKELTTKLQEVHSQNSKLKTENVSLKKNICALLKTARVELVRKNEEISKLNQRLSGSSNTWSKYNKLHHPGFCRTPSSGAKPEDLLSGQQNLCSVRINNSDSSLVGNHRKRSSDSSKCSHFNSERRTVDKDDLSSKGCFVDASKTVPLYCSESHKNSDMGSKDNVELHLQSLPAETCEGSNHSMKHRGEQRSDVSYSRTPEDRHRNSAFRFNSSHSDLLSGQSDSNKKRYTYSEYRSRYCRDYERLSSASSFPDRSRARQSSSEKKDVSLKDKSRREKELNENKKFERRVENDSKDVSKKDAEGMSPAGSKDASKMTEKEIAQSGSIDNHRKTDREKSPTDGKYSSKERESSSASSKKSERERSSSSSKVVSNKVEREKSPTGIKDVSKKIEWVKSISSRDASKMNEREGSPGHTKNVDKKTEREKCAASSKDANRKTESENSPTNSCDSSKKTERENFALFSKDTSKMTKREETPSNNKNVNKETIREKSPADSKDVRRKTEIEKLPVGNKDVGKNTEQGKLPNSRKDISKKSEREKLLINSKHLGKTTEREELPAISNDVSRKKEREKSPVGSKDIHKKMEGEKSPSGNEIMGKKTVTEKSSVCSKDLINKNERDNSLTGIKDVGSKTEREKLLVSSKDVSKKVEKEESPSRTKYASKKTEGEKSATSSKDGNTEREREDLSFGSKDACKKTEREKSQSCSKDASKTTRKEEAPSVSKDSNKKTEREKIAVDSTNVSKKTEREKSLNSTKDINKKSEREKSPSRSKCIDNMSEREKSPISSKENKVCSKPEKKMDKPRQSHNEREEERLRRSERLMNPDFRTLSPRRVSLRSPYKSAEVILRDGSKTPALDVAATKNAKIYAVVKQQTDGISSIGDPRHDSSSKRHRSEGENKVSNEVTKIYRDKVEVTGHKSKGPQMKLTSDVEDDKRKSITARQDYSLLDAKSVNGKVCNSKQDSKQNGDPKLCFMERLNLTVSPVKKNILLSEFDRCMADIPLCENGKTEFGDKEHGQPSSKIVQKSKPQNNEAHDQNSEAESTEADVVLSEATREPIQSSLKNISVLETVEDTCFSLKENLARPSSETLHLVVDSLKEKAPMQSLEADRSGASFQNARDPVQIPDSPIGEVESGERVDVFSVVEYDRTEKSSFSLEFKCSTPCLELKDRVSSLGSSEKMNTSTEPSKLVETVACRLKQMHLTLKELANITGELAIPAAKSVEGPTVCISQVPSVSKEGGIKTIEQTTAFLHDDEGSIQSIDLNQMRHIPELISPLTSPVRMGSQSHKPENSSKQAVVKRLDKDLSSDKQTSSAPKNSTTEINKENQKPDSELANKLENSSCIPISAELEEGEILSESEAEHATVSLNKSHCTISPKQFRESQRHKRGAEIINSEKHSRNVSPRNQHKHDKSRKSHSKSASSSSRCRKKNELQESVLSYSPKQLSTPSSVHEAMLMLEETRKQVRKKYMKLHKDLKERQFVRAIEVAVIDFTKLVKTLNWSRLSADHHLQHLICVTIEMNLEKLKSHGIVRRIFELQHPNMKTSLWRFVEEQLDYLFEKVKRILQRSSREVNRDVGNDKRWLESTGKCRTDSKNMSQSKKKPSPKNRSPKFSVSSSSLITSVKQSFSEEKNQKQMEKESCEHMGKAAEVETINQTSGMWLSFGENTGGSQIEEITPKADTIVTPAFEEDGLKVSDIEKELQNKSTVTHGVSEEGVSESLSFTIVNDAQMGEMFKSLLQGSHNLEPNAVEAESNNETFLLPQTENSGYQSDENISSCESTPRKAYQKSRVIANSFWSTVTPEKRSNFSAEPKTPVQLDVLDESCMLEVPYFMTPGNIACSSTGSQNTSIPSVLLDDLAVSLTVPSPLKSDAHLSFLRAEKECNAPEVLFQEVVTSHYNEGALLEEGDANEENIHLALDSENSSSKSSSSSCSNQEESTGFQYNPSLPMQAVVMEKSNDHFIVKIRCAPSLAPPDTKDLPQVVEEQSVLSSKDEHQKTTEENFSTGESSENSAEKDVGSNAPRGGETSEVLVCPPLSEHDDTKVLPQASYQDFCAFTREEGDCVAASELLACISEDGDHIPAVMHTIEIETDAELDRTAQTSCDMEIINSEFSESQALNPCISQQINSVVARKRKKKTVCQQHTKRKRKKIILDSEFTYKRNQSRKSEVSSNFSSSKKFRKKLSSKKEATCPVMSGSPNSLSAKNVIKKKDGVVVAWTKDDDRQILVECQQTGLSEKTFDFLAAKLSKTPEQVEERFDQLMKLFKRAKKLNI